MLVIFLDFDGVLNIIDGNNSTYMKQELHFEKELINNLNILMDLIPDLKIVISSSWRLDFEDALNNLSLCGFNFKHKIIGHTPIFNDSSIKTRLGEIRAWLKYNSYNNKRIDYLIIDDELTGFNVLTIDKKIGFNKDMLNRVIDFFN